MKNKPIHLQTSNQKPIKTKGDVNGPVKVYYLSQKELEPYHNLKPPTDADGKVLRRSLNGGWVS